MKVASRKRSGKSEEQLLTTMERGFGKKAEALEISDKASHAKALEFIEGCYEFDKRVQAFMGGDIKKAHELWKSLTGKRKKLLDASKAARAIVSRKVVAYEDVERKKQAELEKEKQAELRKKEEEHREDRARTHEEMGMPGLAAEIRNEPIEVPLPAAPQAVAVKEGLGIKGRWKADLISQDPLERQKNLLELVKHVAEHPELIELLTIVPSALNRVAETFKQNLKIPGVRAWEDRKVERAGKYSR